MQNSLLVELLHSRDTEIYVFQATLNTRGVHLMLSLGFYRVRY